MAKSGPSATSVEQPCDVSTEFLDLKKGVAKVIKFGTNVTNEVLQEGLKKYWVDLDVYLKTISVQYAQAPKPVATAMKEKLGRGFEIIVFVLQNGYMSPSKARQGFTKVGFHTTEKIDDPIFGYENSTVDFDKIMSHCYKDIPKETVALIKINAPELIRRFQVNGKLVSDDYKDVGVWQRLTDENFTMVPRDDKVIWQQHAQLMTHDRTVGEWSAYRLGRDPETLAAAALAAAATKAEEKRVETNMRAAHRVVDANAKAETKAIERQIEKARVANLTGNEKAEHSELMRQNKEAAKAKKNASAIAKEAKNAAAIALIATAL